MSIGSTQKGSIHMTHCLLLSSLVSYNTGRRPPASNICSFGTHRRNRLITEQHDLYDRRWLRLDGKAIASERSPGLKGLGQDFGLITQ